MADWWTGPQPRMQQPNGFGPLAGAQLGGLPPREQRPNMMGDLVGYTPSQVPRSNDLAERGNVLPIGLDIYGGKHWAVPGMVKGGWDAFWGAGDAAASGDWEGAGKAGIEAAGLAATGALPFAQRNAVGVFGGRLAKTADTAALAKAEDMAAKGMPREQIWNDTGWFKGADGKWRFEIDDSGANWRYGDDTAGPLSNKFSHKDLMKAYPDLTDARLSRDGRGADGVYIAPFAGKPETFAVGGVDDTRRTLLHEIQHGLQNREDFAPGSSPFAEVMLERTGKITDGSYAGDRYQRSAGEVEARTVQKRMDMTAAQRRARAPWLDYDIPEASQIVRFGQ